MKEYKITDVPDGAVPAALTKRDEIATLKTAQLWAKLRTRNIHSNEVYWAKVELRKRGYCI